MSPLKHSSESPHARPRRRRLSLPPAATYILLALFVVLVVGLAYATFRGVKNLIAGAPLGAGAVATPNFAQQAATADAAGETGDQPLWSEGRVTILVMGIDERESEIGPWRTDTMILLTIDPASRTAGMLSIPRDLWVEIPDYGVYDRINTANFRGDADQYPGGGGPALAMKTVQQNLGAQIDYYATINFRAFVDTIDYLGCIPVEVTETIDDPTYPAPSGNGYDPFSIEPGDYCMGGETLLKYARTRATFGGDFDRARRQQQVLYAIRQHILSTGALPNLLAQAPDIYATLQENISTNLTEGQIIELVRLAADVPDENICSAVINGEYIEQLETLTDGSQVVIPDRAKIRQLILDLYNGTGPCDPATRDLEPEAMAENASIGVMNGTTREGLATETADKLTSLGLTVSAVSNADRFDYDQTQILNYGGKSATAAYLALVLNVPPSAVVTPDNGSSLEDIVVILGADYGQ